MKAQSPTFSTEFRRWSVEGKVRTLPSGTKVRQRPVNLFRLLQAGKIPDSITPQVLELIWSGEETDTRTELQKAMDWQGFLDLVTTASVMSIIIGDDVPEQEEVKCEDFDNDDQIDIHNWARHPFRKVKMFPVEQDPDLESGSEGGENEQVAKRVSAGTSG